MLDNKRFLIALFTLLLTLAIVLRISQRGVPLVLQTNLENLPMEISGYIGSDDRFSDEVYAELNADQHVYRHYKGSLGEINLYIGYYGTAKGGRTGHNPYACLPGSGWAIVERGVVTVPTSYRPDGVTLNYLVASKDGVNNVLLHWYQAAGTQVLATGLQQNVQRFTGRVLHNRNDGAYVQVSSFAEAEYVSEIRATVQDFAQRILEQLPAYWPLEG